MPMFFDSASLDAILLSIRLASTVSILLLLIATPLAWWLANTQSAFKGVISSIVALPIVLPPSVIGFYLLLAMGETGPIGMLTQSLNLGLLPFSFSGLVVASLFYSLPFVVQPIQNAFEAIGKQPLEMASVLGASPLDRFITVALPLAKPGLLSGVILGFAHTLGEFGVVLMIGGNIPGSTQVVSVLIYDQVEALDYQQAHKLSLFMLVFSFICLWFLYSLPKQYKVKHGRN